MVLSTGLRFCLPLLLGICIGTMLPAMFTGQAQVSPLVPATRGPAAEAQLPSPVGPAGPASPDPPTLELPNGTRGVIINVGTNAGPIEPPANNQSIVVIAVEPILDTAKRINRSSRMLVLTCAIAAPPARLQTMYALGGYGVSSSLSKPANMDNPRFGAFYRDGAEGDKHSRKTYIVPVLSMELLLRSIPLDVDIVHLKTDMQGYDFSAVKSAGTTICRIPSLLTELYVRGDAPYVGVQNDLDEDWIPYMTKMGYTLTNSQDLHNRGAVKRTGKQGQFAKELDGLWRRERGKGLCATAA